MNSNSLFYQESRKISWIFHLFSYLLAISLALIFSYVYSKVSIFISDNESNAYCSFENVYLSSSGGFKQTSLKIKNYKLSNLQAQTILMGNDYKKSNYFTIN